MSKMSHQPKKHVSVVKGQATTNPRDSSDAPTTRPWIWITLTVLLVIHALLCIHTASRKSATVDEVAHLPAGISYWQQGTFELYHHNPPLIKLLAALPALAQRPTVDYSKSWQHQRERGFPLSQWAFGWEFMYDNAARYHTIYFWSRLVVVALSVVAGLVLFLWASESFGPESGLVAATLWTFSPNVIAHASLVTTDIGAVALGFIATYVFWRYLQRNSWSLAVVSGLFLGLAQLTKFSLLLLYFCWPALALIIYLLRRRLRTAGRPETAATRGSQPSSLPLLSLQGFMIIVVSIFVINLGYCFEGTGVRLGDYSFLSETLTRPRSVDSPPENIPSDHPARELLEQRENRFRRTWIAGIPVPLPRHYVMGFDEQRWETEGGYTVYLWGTLRDRGWWWYYLFAMAVKVPLGTWMLTILAAILAALSSTYRAPFADEVTWLLPALTVLFAMSFLTDINLGIRYVLPIMPFWFLVVSRIGRAKNKWLVACILLGLGFNAISCTRFHPHHLAYFNEAVGGPSQGDRYLLDSNLDWGQDLRELRRWLEQYRPDERVGLATFGNLDPSILAAEGEPLHFSLPPPVKLNQLQLLSISPTGKVRRLIQDFQRQDQRGSAPNKLAKLIAKTIDLHEGPQPGLFAVSANIVHGLPCYVRDQDGNLWRALDDPYGYFRRLQPIAKVGYSIFIYDISLAQANLLREELGMPLLRK